MFSGAARFFVLFIIKAVLAQANEASAAWLRCISQGAVDVAMVTQSPSDAAARTVDGTAFRAGLRLVVCCGFLHVRLQTSVAACTVHLTRLFSVAFVPAAWPIT